MMRMYILYNGELYHHGVKGMKWGKRRYQNPDGTLTEAGKKRQEYGDAKTKHREAEKELRRAGRFALGHERIQRFEASKKQANDAYADRIVAKANYKDSKSRNDGKAEFKTYVKAMYKDGLPDSAADARGRSRALYDRLTVDKGKEYADRVAKKVQNRAVGALAGTAIVAVGATVAVGILESRR